MSPSAMWDKTKSGSKKGFDKAYAVVDKLGPPVNRLSNKLGAEAFWPTTLDIESDKAARILRSFCKDGFYQEEMLATRDGPKQKQKVVKKIPKQVIAQAKGLAIFTTMRTGLWVSGAGGSGVLVGRKPDGSWSPPSGIMLHTAGLGFLVGVDIYDCVVVINSQAALDAFSKVRCTLGGEVSAVAGPVGVGGVLETEVHKRQAPIWTYLKSRGFYAGVQIDGTVVIERTDENERFYGERIGVGDILAGKVRHPPRSINSLLETIRAAQGDSNVDETLLAEGSAPGDVGVEEEGRIFGIPNREDPDPYGVRALEMEGLEIREAGTKSRPSSEQFEFKPSPTSPVFNTFSRRSAEYHHARNRFSISRQSIDRSTQTIDESTQTNGDTPNQADLPRANGNISPAKRSPQLDRTSPPVTPRIGTYSPTNGFVPITTPERAPARRPSMPTVVDHEHEHEHKHEHEHDEDDSFKAVEVHGVHHGSHAQAASPIKARLVTIPKRIPPALPPRSPARARIVVNGDRANVDGFLPANTTAVTHDRGTGGDGPPSPVSMVDQEVKEVQSKEASPPTSSVASSAVVNGIHEHGDVQTTRTSDLPSVKPNGVGIDDKSNRRDKPEDDNSPSVSLIISKETHSLHVLPSVIPAPSVVLNEKLEVPSEVDTFHSVPTTPTTERLSYA
ncbi:MAG: hypothetical protein M1825_001330 [Sarcosagium campestre]|nr:MAG: hypothetical protein M1825_001330 [Sarcosagium campestre]